MIFIRSTAQERDLLDPVWDTIPLTGCKVAGAYANNAQQYGTLSIAFAE